MKILYATRLFSGLQSSLAARQWQPTGVPTIFKAIEALDHEANDAVFVLACKDQDDGWREARDVRLQIAGLRHPLWVLAGPRRFPKWLRPVAGPLREAAHALAIARLCRRQRPDLVYIDHANIFVAGWLSLVCRVRLVLRLMGIYPVMRAALDGGSLRARIMRWCYRRRFSLVICTQDGSGVETWLERALRADVPRVVLLNGIDEPDRAAVQDPRIAAIPDDRIVVMFLGKLDPAKGPLEFADGFLKASRQMPGRLHALIVGAGSLTNAVCERFSAAGLTGQLALVERLPHAQVAAAFRRADIYVSLNRFGNLSNANLEAMRAGKAMIVPAAQPETGIDAATDRMISAEAIVRIGSSDDVDGLAAAIVRLAGDPSARASLSGRLLEETRDIALSWPDRIALELDLLRRVARAEPLELSRGISSTRRA